MPPAWLEHGQNHKQYGCRNPVRNHIQNLTKSRTLVQQSCEVAVEKIQRKRRNVTSNRKRPALCIKCVVKEHTSQQHTGISNKVWYVQQYTDIRTLIVTRRRVRPARLGLWFRHKLFVFAFGLRSRWHCLGDCSRCVCVLCNLPINFRQFLVNGGCREEIVWGIVVCG